jgi:hypothetical protein
MIASSFFMARPLVGHHVGFRDFLPERPEAVNRWKARAKAQLSHFLAMRFRG